MCDILLDFCGNLLYTVVCLLPSSSHPRKTINLVSDPVTGIGLVSIYLIGKCKFEQAWIELSTPRPKQLDCKSKLKLATHTKFYLHIRDQRDQLNSLESETEISFFAVSDQD